MIPWHPLCDFFAWPTIATACILGSKFDVYDTSVNIAYLSSFKSVLIFIVIVVFGKLYAVVNEHDNDVLRGRGQHK